MGKKNTQWIHNRLLYEEEDEIRKKKGVDF